VRRASVIRRPPRPCSAACRQRHALTAPLPSPPTRRRGRGRGLRIRPAPPQGGPPPLWPAQRVSSSILTGRTIRTHGHQETEQANLWVTTRSDPALTRSGATYR
jgi:hypothetical protein